MSWAWVLGNPDVEHKPGQKEREKHLARIGNCASPLHLRGWWRLGVAEVRLHLHHHHHSIFEDDGDCIFIIRDDSKYADWTNEDTRISWLTSVPTVWQPEECEIQINQCGRRVVISRQGTSILKGAVLNSVITLKYINEPCRFWTSESLSRSSAGRQWRAADEGQPFAWHSHPLIAKRTQTEY